MRIRLIKKQTLTLFFNEHPRSMVSLEMWLTRVKFADWEKPEDIRSTFGSVDYLGCGTQRVVFNIGGNVYRMICKYHFGAKKVHLFICWIGTHAEYSELCNNKRQYDVNKY
mgnify:CR=1 FL=1